MPKKSAGLLLYRYLQDPQGLPLRAGRLQVLLVHPGGPYWAKKDDGAWSIPKGEYGDDEEPLAAAVREFEEEMGSAAAGEFVPLDPVRQPGGKTVVAWAVGADFDPASLRSNTFPMEWPPRSGQTQQFPEIDKAAWFDLETARHKILKGQVPLLDQLLALIGSDDRPS